MERHIFRGILKQHISGVDFDTLRASVQEWYQGQAGVLRCHWFVHEQQLFIYTEQATAEVEVCPPDWAAAWLQVWPDVDQARYLIPMMDVFHDGDDDWRVHVDVDADTEVQPQGSLARLRPSQYASYVYYHYQMQEEKRYSFNASYMIGASEDWIFSYSEQPCGVRRPAPEGKLSTQATPDNWHEVMLPHFQPWAQAASDEQPLLWMKLEHVYSYVRV